MELLLSTGNGNSSSINQVKRQWTMNRRKYSRRIMCGSPVSIRRKTMPIVRLGGSGKRVLWRIRSVPKFRSIKLLSSVPLKLWSKLKNAYTNMMMNLAGNVGGSTGNAFAVKTTSSSNVAEMEPLCYDKDEFEKRLIFEIYKSIVASHH